MKAIYINLALLAITFFVYSCTKEDKPGFTSDLGFAKQLTPPADAPPVVKEMYQHYGVWVRMDFNNWKEVTNGVLATDPINRWGVGKIEDAYRSSALTYSHTLLSGVSEKFAQTFFPLEIFFVKTYSGSFWAKDIERIGRSRLIICWPNQMRDALPITNPETHYYKDSVLASAVWNFLGYMVADRIATPPTEFVLAGKAYDNGEAQDKIRQKYYDDGDIEAMETAYNELAKNGGFITASGSSAFATDFSDWQRLLATESYDNIKTRYLDNSPARARKYEVIIRFFKSYGWDIQATGNLYRQKHDE